jgi:co-chaperonin GroES (HSP10)
MATTVVSTSKDWNTERQKRYRIRPRHEWVVVRKEVQGERITADGVVVPEREQMRSFRGVVVDVSDGIVDLKAGDRVIYSAYPMEMEDDIVELTGDRNLFMVRDEEVYATLEAIEESCT